MIITKNDSVFNLDERLTAKVDLKPNNKKLWIYLVIYWEEKIFADYINSLNIVDVTIFYPEDKPHILKLVDNNPSCNFIVPHKCEIPYQMGFLPSNTVFINTEYINMEEIHKNLNCSNIVFAQEKGYKVIDFSELNIKRYKSLYLPYQIREKENNFLKECLKKEKEADVSTCGGLSDRRKHILIEGEKNKLFIADVKGYTAERDEDIGASNILLNIHQHDNAPHFEHIRCDRWIYAGHTIVSEDSYKQELLDIYPHVIFAPYDKLIETCKKVVGKKEPPPPIPKNRQMTDIEDQIIAHMNS